MDVSPATATCEWRVCRIVTGGTLLGIVAFKLEEYTEWPLPKQTYDKKRDLSAPRGLPHFYSRFVELDESDEELQMQVWAVIGRFRRRSPWSLNDVHEFVIAESKADKRVALLLPRDEDKMTCDEAEVGESVAEKAFSRIVESKSA